MKDYLHDGAYRLEYALRKIEELPEPNRKYAKEYMRFLDLHSRKARTIARRLHELRYWLNLLDKDAKKANKKDIEDLILKINKSDAAITSRSINKLTLKNFYKFLYGSEEFPDVVRWIKIERPKNAKLPKDLLTQQEMIKLIENCKSNRDKTIISLFSTFGCRVGELLNLKYKDIRLSDDDEDEDEE